jgi:hypothetical protein
MWFLYKKVILTKDNIAKRQWAVLSVSFVVITKRLIIYLYLILLHVLFGELCISHTTYLLPPVSTQSLWELAKWD